MKTFITLSSILAAGTLAVNAATLSYTNLLDSSTGWNFTTGVSGRNGEQIFDGSLTFKNCNWAQHSEYYALPLSLADDEILTLSVSVGISSNIDSVQTIALAASEGKTFVIGRNYNATVFSYGTLTDTSKEGFLVTSGTEPKSAFAKVDSVTNTSVTSSASGVYNFEVAVQKNGGNWVANAAIDGVNVASDIELGTSFSLRGISLFIDGGNSMTNGVFSNLLLTTIPEPSMFGLLAGLGVLAIAGTRRRRR